MARKRMFSLSVVDSDAFLDMPLSAQALYFHLNMRADDDGFIGNPKRIQSVVGASADDMRLLIAKRFILTFDDGVIVIKHWRMHNTLSANRYHETKYIDEKKDLLLKQNGAYSFTSGDVIDDRKQVLIGKRQAKDEQKTNSGLGLGLDLGLEEDKDNTIVEKNSTVHIPYKEIVDYLNKVVGSNYRSSTKATQRCIKARFKEGFTLEDFFLVIDTMNAEWKNDSKMVAYLRPETLFGTKFESYLNRAPKKIVKKPKEEPIEDDEELVGDDW